ncbi:hypothetical protein CSB69_3777 [Morganella morganii]|nr:hypothetical protein CSB69_3777 [Morganella morganii]
MNITYRLSFDISLSPDDNEYCNEEDNYSVLIRVLICFIVNANF